MKKSEILDNSVFLLKNCVRNLSILLLILAITPMKGQVDIFTEGFDESTGSTTGASDEGINWSATCLTCTSGGQHYQVQNGVMEGLNTDGVATWLTDPIDISSCATITVSFDYAGDPFPGSGNLESFDECSGCAGNVNLPSGPGCGFCWDFMAFYVNIDGVSNEIGVIGTGINETSYYFEYTSPCLNGAQEATLEVNTQTWAADENMTFDNVLLVCNISSDGADLIVANPDPDLCEGENLTLSAPPGFNSYIWSGPAGSSSSQDWQIDNLGLADAGTYFLTLVDNNGCNINEEIEITVSGGPSAMISGGGNLCLGQCLDIAFAITGGTGPYTVDMEISVDPFSVPFTIPSVEIIDTVTICADASGIIPEYDPSTNTIHVPQITGITATVVLQGITDSAGCEGTVDPTPVSLTLVNPPVAQDPGDLEACDTDGDGLEDFDLSQLESIINGGGSNAVHFYSDVDLTIEIFSPYSSGSATIYATTENADCASEPVNFNLVVIAGPVITPLADQDICNEYILPVINGSNLSGNEAYFTGPGGTGQKYEAGQTITSSVLLYIYDANGMCSSEESFMVNIFPGPDILPSGDVLVCDFYELPAIDGNNLSGNEAYYTGNSGNGISYMAGDVISSDITLNMYDGSPGCDDEESFNIVVVSSPHLDNLNDTIVCNGFTLPPITGQNLSGGQAYYLASEGNGPNYQPGAFIDFSAIIYIYDSNINCADEVSFNVIVTQGPSIDVVSDTSVCSPFVLPDIQGNGLTGNEAYYSGSGGSGTSYESGDTIFADQFLYIYDGAAGCEAEVSFNIEIGDGLSAGTGSSTVICDGSVINLFDFIVNEDPGGSFSDPSNSGGLIGNMFDGSGLAGQSFMFLYEVDNGGACPNDSSFVIVDVVTELLAGEDTIINICTPGDLDLLDYLNGGDAGGVFTDLSNTNFLSGSVLELDSLLPGNYAFEYTIGDGLVCAEYTALMEVNWQPAPEFINGIDTVFSCSYYILPSINGNFLNGQEAYYLESDGMGTAYDPGDTLFSSAVIYLFGESDSCSSEVSYDLNIEILPDAGDDNMVNVCAGSQVDLQNMLQNADTTGVFIDPNNTGTLTGSVVNTSAQTGILSFQYVTEGFLCPNDTSTISIEISSELFAGTDTLTSVCAGQLIDLTALAESGDTGGIFAEELASGALQDNMFDTGLLQDGMYELWYIVGDGVTCPEDSASIQITVATGPILDPIQDTISCFDFIVPDLTGTNLSGNEQFSTLPNGGGLVLNTGDQLFSDQWVYMSDGNGLCQSSDSFYVDIATPLSAGNDVDLQLCENNVINLAFNLDGADLGGQFIDPLNSGMLNGVSFSGSGNPGDYMIYYVQPSQQVCPADTAIFSINVQEMLFAGNDIDLELCEGEILDLTTVLVDADMGGAFFDIGGSGGLSNGIINTSGLGGQVLDIVYSVGNGGVCMADNADLMITVLVLPVLDPVTDINACDAYQLPAIAGSGLTGSEAYYTAPGGQGISYDPGDFIDANTNLYIYAGASGCSDELSFNISIQSLLFEAQMIQASCPNDDSGEMEINGIQEGTAPYEIFLDNTSYGSFDDPDIILTSLAAGTYDILILDANDCSFETQITIDESPTINLTLPSLVTINEGESKQILIDLLPSNYTITWLPDTDISCTDCFDPTFNPTTTTEYFYTITDLNGCMISQSIIIEVRESEGVYVANIFSPNRDGLNDHFYIQTKSTLDILNMAIFNRFGEKMFESKNTQTNDPNAGWDGKFKGRSLNPGVYTYYFEILLPSGEQKTFSGALTLVK